MNIQEELKDLMGDNGAYTNHRAVPEELLKEFKGKLPDFLLELWKQYGFGCWSNGLYHLCNPHDFKELLPQIFHEDKDLSHKDCHVFAYAAFGDLQVWSERYGVVNINLTHSTLRCINLAEGRKTKNPSLEIAFSLDLDEYKKKSINAYDDADKPLFARARKRLGDLEPGECYGFFPALAMGGAPKLENLKRTDALSHFSFLAQFQPFTLVDYLSRPIKTVRQIG